MNRTVDRSIIINGRQQKGKRFAEYCITIVGWTYMVLVLLQVLFSILLWGAGIHYFGRFILSDGYLGQTLSLLWLTVKVSAAVLGLAIFWSFYNKQKYGKLRRRTAPKDVSVAELSETFLIQEELIVELQTNRWVNLDGELEQLQKSEQTNIAGKERKLLL